MIRLPLVLSLWLGFGCLFLPHKQAWADGMIIVPHYKPAPQQFGMPHWVLERPFAPLAVKKHHVTVNIDKQVATTEIRQVFFNPLPEWLEGIYLFPLPEGAQIDRFSIDVDGKELRSEIMTAEQARETYETLVRQTRDPALLEYAGRGLFKVRVPPFAGRTEKVVRIRYTQLLRSEGGLTGYTYPLNTEKFSSQPIESVEVKIQFTGSGVLKTVYSPTHPVLISRAGAGQATVSYSGKDIKPDKDFQVLFVSEPEQHLSLKLLPHRAGKDPGYFMMMISPGAGGMPVVSKDVVFVVDTSMSMTVDNKIIQAKNALQTGLKHLNPGDRFEIVRFSDTVEPLFGSLTGVSAESLERSSKFVANLNADGYTALDGALRTALEPVAKQGQDNRPCVVFLLTDGEPSVGETNADEILKKITATIGKRSVRIFPIGIGSELNTYLLDGLAQRTRGLTQYLLEGEDIEAAVSGFFIRTSKPVLSNPVLSITGGAKLHQMVPAVFPDFFQNSDTLVFGRYEGSGPSVLHIEGWAEGKKQSYEFKVDLPEKTGQYGFIPRTWAMRMIGKILSEIRLHGEKKEAVDVVVSLAREYGIVTPYTSYLVNKDEQDRKVPNAMQTFVNSVGTQSFVLPKKMGAERSGKGAVLMARSAGAMEGTLSADAVSPARPGAGNAPRNSSGNAKDQGIRDDNAPEESVRYVGGRAFYWRAGQWVDGRIQSRPQARRIRMTFGSGEYFALLTKHPEAAPWMALGKSLAFLLGEEIYEITPPAAKN